MSYIMNIFNNYLLVILRWKDFKGRSNRSEFWSFKFIDIVISNIIYLLIYYITYPLVISCLIGMGVVYYLFTFVPYLFLIIRRLHDAGWSGKWCILPLILEVHFVISDIYPSFYQIIAALKPTSLILVLLLYLVILVVISLLIAVFIVILFLKGDKGENQYGLPPTNYFMISSTIPKGRVTNLEVIYNGPEQRYSIAKMNWNG